jgi:hypothetical protein
VLYKLLGILTWKAIRFYVGRKLPRRTVVAGVVLVGIAAVTAASRLRETEG